MYIIKQINIIIITHNVIIVMIMIINYHYLYLYNKINFYVLFGNNIYILCHEKTRYKFKYKLNIIKHSN